MMRSGQLKSSTAHPLVKNIGWQTSRLFSPFSFEYFFNCSGRTYADRRNDGEHLEAACCGSQSDDEVFQPLRGIFREKNLPGRGGPVHRGRRNRRGAPSVRLRRITS